MKLGSFNKIITVILTAIITVPFIISNSLKYDLSIYPYPFIKNREVIAVIGAGGEHRDQVAAVSIITNLIYNEFYVTGKTYNVPEQQGLPILYGIKIVNASIIYENTPSIIIGGPCANEAAAILMNVSQEWPNCVSEFEEGKALIKLYEINGTPYLLVAGYSKVDTEKAAYVLSNYLSFNLTGNAIEVYGEKATGLNITSLSD